MYYDLLFSKEEGGTEEAMTRNIKGISKEK